MTIRVDTTPISPLPDVDAATLANARAIAPLDPAFRGAFVAAPGPAQDNLDRLFDDSALCVTTGQQPGLFTGPLFTVYKALSAIALAQRLARELERPVVPVFWVAGDDHDLAEANHVHVTDMANVVHRLVLHEREDAETLTPLYKEPLGVLLDGPRQAIVDATPDTEFKADVLDLLDRHYRPDTDYATAFGATLSALLGRLGLVVLRSTSRAAKEAMRPVLRRTLEEAASIDRALAVRGEALAAAGKPVPVHVGDGAAPLMIEGSLGRDRLVPENGHFVARRSGERWSLAELSALLESDPERFSPNVLLRPIVEASILPTLVYVAGPGELAYFPQSTPLYECCDVIPQLPISRWSGRIVEGKIAKVLAKFEIVAEDLASPEGQLEAKLASGDMPAEGVTAFAKLRQGLQTHYHAIESAAVSIDPTMRKAVQAARNTSLAASKDLEKRLVAHLKSHNETLTNQIAKARNHLFPMGKPQERVLNIMPYLVRYGPTLIDELFDACRRWYGGEVHSNGE